MYVQLSYTTAAAVLVSLLSDNPNALTVLSKVTVPANNSYAYFTVTGVGVGMANVTATGVKPAAAVPVRISMPKFVVSLASTSNAGQKATITVYAEDSLGNTRNLVSPVTVSLASTNPNRRSTSRRGRPLYRRALCSTRQAPTRSPPPCRRAVATPRERDDHDDWRVGAHDRGGLALLQPGLRDHQGGPVRHLEER
jgi:hypothetical protein